MLLNCFVLGCCSPVQISGVGGRMVELAGVSSAGWVATRLWGLVEIEGGVENSGQFNYHCSVWPLLEAGVMTHHAGQAMHGVVMSGRKQPRHCVMEEWWWGSFIVSRWPLEGGHPICCLMEWGWDGGEDGDVRKLHPHHWHIIFGLWWGCLNVKERTVINSTTTVLYGLSWRLIDVGGENIWCPPNIFVPITTRDGWRRCILCCLILRHVVDGGDEDVRRLRYPHWWHLICCLCEAGGGMKTIRVDGITSIGAACCNVGSKKGCPLDVWRSSVASSCGEAVAQICAGDQWMGSPHLLPPECWGWWP